MSGDSSIDAERVNVNSYWNENVRVSHLDRPGDIESTTSSEIEVLRLGNLKQRSSGADQELLLGEYRERQEAQVKAAHRAYREGRDR